jgi:hypothetical protein
MSPRKAVSVAACLITLTAMPILFRKSVGALASAEGLRQLGEAVTLLDSLRSAGIDASPLMILLPAGGNTSPQPSP